jgi:hypothetical protein
MEKIRIFFGWLRGAVSPVYVSMLIAAFVLWFITKLGDTYTTDHEVTVIIDNVEYNVHCTIRGKGTDLVNYTLSSQRSNFEIPLSDLTQDKPMNDNDGNTVVHVTAESMKLALAQRMNHIEVVAVGSVPIILKEARVEKVNEVEKVPAKPEVVSMPEVVEAQPAVIVEEPVVNEEISFDDEPAATVAESVSGDVVVESVTL